MSTVNLILDYFAKLPPELAFFWLLMQNILQFVLCVGGGILLLKLFSARRIYQAPAPLSSGEIWLSIVCVVLNSVVAFAGWYLWKLEIIQISREVGWYSIVDVLALLLMMDFLMYATHRVVHLPGIYSWVHRTHHLFEDTRPLSLFVLSPLEVFGFGALWLIVLSLYKASWLGIVVYLLLNAAFGALGHIGVEPFPSNWLKIPIISKLTTSTFHAQHHKEIDSNFGFYTDIWDNLFGSINDKYRTTFEKAASKR